MSQINVPAYCYTRDDFMGNHSTVVFECQFLQKTLVTTQPNQPADMTGPENQVITPNQVSITPDLPLAEVEIALTSAPFNSTQPSAITLFVTNPGGTKTGYGVGQEPGELELTVPINKTICPTAGSYQMYVEFDWEGDTYITNYAVVILNQPPKN